MTIQTALTALNSWDGVTGRLDHTFSGYPDEQLYQEIAPGRNRVIYLLGHLTAVNDWMLPTLGFGERLYPELEVPFLTKPDRASGDYDEPALLRRKWAHVNEAVREHLGRLPPEEWLNAHARVSAEEFAANPSRNRLSVVLNRVGHMWSHLGQLALAAKKTK